MRAPQNHPVAKKLVLACAVLVHVGMHMPNSARRLPLRIYAHARAGAVPVHTREGIPPHAPRAAEPPNRAAGAGRHGRRAAAVCA